MAATNPPPAAAQNIIEVVWGSMNDLWIGFLHRTPLLVAAMIVVILTWVVVRIATSLLHRMLSQRKRLKRGIKDLFVQIFSVMVWTVGFVVAAVIAFPGVTAGKVLAALGLTSIALGFAFKDIIENFLAGILILWRFPFDPGDFVRWSDIEGQIEEITVRMTLIRKTDGELVVLPNATLLKDPVYVLTDRDVRRVTFECGIAYGEGVDEGRSVIQAAVNGCESVRKDQPIQVFAREFGDSSINFEVTWWTGALPLDIRKSRDEVIAAVKAGLDNAGIEIPFPYRTLTFKQPLHTVSHPEPTGDR